MEFYAEKTMLLESTFSHPVTITFFFIPEGSLLLFSTLAIFYYFGGARSKGFATLRDVSKLQFFDKIGQAKSVGLRPYSAI